MLYTGLYSSQINSNANLLYLDTVNRLINKYNYDSLPISFISLHYNYNKLKDYTLTNNLMTVSNEQLYDVANRPESPYETKTLFAIAPIRQAAFTGSNQFVFRPELFLGNTGKTISSIAYKKQGAGSYQTIAFNTAFTISYDSAGFYNLDIKITYTDSSIMYGHTKIVVYENPNYVGARYGTSATPATNEAVTATTAYLGQFATGDITIDLAANNNTGQIRKPLIVVEGFDAENNFDYNYYSRLWINFDNNHNDYWNYPITLNEGLDDINEYDLIFLNFSNGTDYIQRNAYLLERVIEIVNSRKTTWNGTRQDNVIIGMSMGGLVARYALRDMELNSEDHETRLFISHDVPHWGANIPVGLQAAVQHLGPWKIINTGGNFPWISWVDMFPAVADALDMFNSPAAKQMLIQRYTLSGQTLTADNSVHNTFLNELNTMGWPQNCRNLTLSNGSCNGTKQFADNNTIFTMDGDRSMTYFGSLWRSLLMTVAGGSTIPTIVTGSSFQFNQWAMLWQFPLSLFATSSSIGLDFKVRAVPSNGIQEIYRGDIYSKKKILWVINVKNYFIKCHVNSNTGMLPLDNAPGGVYDINEFGIDPAIIASQLPSFFSGYVTASVLEPRFDFVPTVSSLSIINPATNLTSDICDNISCLIPEDVQHHFAPQQNELHISFTQDNADWILEQQNPATNCIKICTSNLSISGDNIVCTTSNNYTIPNLPAGVTVTWSASPLGIATINSPNSTQTTLTKNNNGFITLAATIANACGGGNIVINKQIGVGYTQILNIGYPSSTVAPDELIPMQIFIAPDNLVTGNQELVITRMGGGYTNTLYTGGDGAVEFSFPMTGTYNIKVYTYNDCGWSTNYFPLVFFCTNDETFMLSPNPANTSLAVKLSDETGQSENVKDNGTGIKEIQLTDKMGNVLKRYVYHGTDKQVTIDVSTLKADIYYIRLFNGKQWIGKSFMKQ